jgi:uncharacterized protein YndB with AHSA1/START domain
MDTLQTVYGRPVLRVERHFKHPVDKVWRAITEPAQLSQWFPSDMEFEPRVGGTVHFVFREGQAPPSEGVVMAYDPPRLFEYSWGDGTVLRFELEPTGAGCQLIFTHTFDERPSAASFAAGWHICLDCLDATVAGDKPDPGLARWASLHEGYVHSFGLDEGEILDHDSGWEIHFDRQLTRSVDDVWSLLVGSSGAAVGAPPPPVLAPDAVDAGPVSAIEAPNVIELGEGRVRWQLSDGNGGARLLVTHTVPKDVGEGRCGLLDAWHDHLEALAKQLSSG